MRMCIFHERTKFKTQASVIERANMSTLVRNFPSSKVTEENRVHAVKGTKYRSIKERENPLIPQKSHQVPLKTPRKALGNLSNTPWQKGPTDLSHRPKSTVKPVKVSSSLSETIHKKKCGAINAQRPEHNCDDLLDIEFMPMQCTKPSGDVVPQTFYFSNLTNALKATTTIPPSMLNNLSKPELPSSLSLCVERRQHNHLPGTFSSHENSEFTLQEDTDFLDLPEIPSID